MHVGHIELLAPPRETRKKPGVLNPPKLVFYFAYMYLKYIIQMLQIAFPCGKWHHPYFPVWKGFQFILYWFKALLDLEFATTQKSTCIMPNYWYCWWLKSCTTWDVWNPINNGIFTISTGEGFQPSTVVWNIIPWKCFNQRFSTS